MMRACGLGLFAFVAAVSFGQDPLADVGKIASKGQKGELVPAPFRAYMVVDNRYPPKVAGSMNPDDRHPKDTTNKMHDLVAEHGLNPVVAVFVRADAKKLADTGVHKLAVEMNKLMTIPDYRGNKLASFVTFLRVEGMQKTETVVNPDKSKSMVELDAEYPDDEKRDVYATDIRDLASAIKAPNVVFGLAPLTSKAAAAWNIDEKDDVTVVFFNRNRIVDRWKFGAEGPDDNQIKAILAAVEESVLGTKKP
jgi:hypothetical protein